MVKIQIIRGKCARCGICRLRCPACFTADENGVAAIRNNAASCISCGHCVALCSHGAVVHADIPLEAIEPLGNSSISPDEFEILVKKRRSHRRFENRAVPDEMLKRLLDIACFSPTGVNVQEVSVKVLRRPERIRALAEGAVRYFADLSESLEAEASSYKAEGVQIPETLDLKIKKNARYRNMAASFEKGHDPIFHKAPAVFVFHAPELCPTPKDDCVIASHTVVLAAETIGLGTCYIGLFNRACAENAALRERLSLPEGHRVFSTVILGFPALHFKGVPPRQRFHTTWE